MSKLDEPFDRLSFTPPNPREAEAITICYAAVIRLDYLTMIERSE